MALLTSSEEFRKLLPISASFNYDLLKPYVEQAEIKFIIPILSQEQYDSLQTAYDNFLKDPVASPLSADNEALLKKISMPLVHYAFYLYLEKGQVIITDRGIKVMDGDKEKAADWKQINDLRRSEFSLAYDGTDQLLAFLLKKKSVYTAWAASDVYKSLFEFFINSAEEFSKYIGINNSYRTFLFLRPIMRKIEEFRIKPLVPAADYDAIKAAILANDITTLTATQASALKLIKPVVAHLTMSRAIVELSVQINENGIQVLSVSAAGNLIYASAADKDRLSVMRYEFEKDGLTYLKDLEDLYPTDTTTTSTDGLNIYNGL